MSFTDKTKNRKILLVLSVISLIGLLFYISRFFIAIGYSLKGGQAENIIINAFWPQGLKTWLNIALDLVMGILFFAYAFFCNQKDKARLLLPCLLGAASLWFVLDGFVMLNNLFINRIGYRFHLFDIDIALLCLIFAVAIFFGVSAVLLIFKPDRYITFKILTYLGVGLIALSLPYVISDTISNIRYGIYLAVLWDLAYNIILLTLFVGMWQIGKNKKTEIGQESGATEITDEE